jgi:hypothetical protein
MMGMGRGGSKFQLGYVTFQMHGDIKVPMPFKAGGKSSENRTWVGGKTQ